MSLAVDPLRDGDAILSLLAEAVAVGNLRGGRLCIFGVIFSPGARHSLPGPPVRLVGLTVERSLAGDGDVFALEGVDERRVVHQLDALPPREHVRVVSRIAAEAERGPGLQVQLHAALEPDRAGEVLAGRDDHASATGEATGAGGFGESG